MQNISAGWLYPIILTAGALQAWGPPMNHTLRVSLENPWLRASFRSCRSSRCWPVSSCAFLTRYRRRKAWQRCRGGRRLAALSAPSRSSPDCCSCGKVGAGAFAGLTITANILMSLAIDRFGMFGMQVHELSAGRIAGAALMVAGIILISKF